MAENKNTNQRPPMGPGRHHGMAMPVQKPKNLGVVSKKLFKYISYKKYTLNNFFDTTPKFLGF